MMNKPAAVIGLCGCLLWGCRKQEVPSTAGNASMSPEQTAQIESQYLLATNIPESAEAANAKPAQKGSHPGQIAQPLQDRINGAVHASLTIQLRMFIEKNGRVPAGFSEFANSAMDSVPLAPDGMKFVIDSTDRTVKVVKK